MKLKRSQEPIFWLLFGGGGTLAALVGVVLIVITGILVPTGTLPPDTMSYAAMHAFAATLFGKVAIFLVISLLLWHGVHRMAATAHHVGLASAHTAQIVLRGFAALATAACAYLLTGL
ncbi:fumarate reductase subunit FrdD [Blastochloris tepida]|uniref:Fumarate reductase subunit D n=1 Tax=Blastochloris tepida TaxID=2233851 RepID=A0A348G2N0_9HYPH|nr:fumarate reductase subunit FrdD [Blastochloris tepida]BBF93813.1 fumarate reductase subunit D [Blastochloris tepida]